MAWRGKGVGWTINTGWVTIFLFIFFTVDDQPLRDHPPGRVVTSLATIVARVKRPERLKGQHAIVIVHPGNGCGRAQRAAGVVLRPRDGQWQVATDHRARDAGSFTHVHRTFRRQCAEPWRHCNLVRCTRRHHTLYDIQYILFLVIYHIIFV